MRRLRRRITWGLFRCDDSSICVVLRKNFNLVTMKRFYAMTLLMVVCTLVQAKAQEWISLGKDNQGEEHFFYTKFVNSEDSEGFGVWTKYGKTEYTTFKGKRTALHREVKQLLQIKCGSSEIAVVQTVIYNSVGEVVRSHKEYPEFSAIIPESIGEAIATNACQLNESKKNEEIPN